MFLPTQQRGPHQFLWSKHIHNSIIPTWKSPTLCHPQQKAKYIKLQCVREQGQTQGGQASAFTD
eukprot:scaffold179853_cov21-Tisochrysis_lutea.AAC.2